MITVAAAQQLIGDNLPLSRECTVALSESIGRYLADDITTDIDSPPYDKSLVDGYAVRRADLQQGLRRFEFLEEVTAGAVPTREVTSGSTTRIMTGAPLPTGADCVVMVEQSTVLNDNVIQLDTDPLPAGANIMTRGRSMTAGEVVLEPGKLIRSIEIALLAEVGCHQVMVMDPPTVAVMSTGDELVEPSQMPQPGQIRNSNSYMLAALAAEAGTRATNLGIGRDTVEDLSRLVEQGLTHDVLLLSGGVSAGVLDLVPGVLAAADVREVFHKVHLKPGKPIWFGVGPAGQLVFGLPGNPVSSLVCFRLFVQPALQRLLGAPTPLPYVAQLSHAHPHRGGRPTYFPAFVENESITLVNWKGSADMRSLTAANCLAFFPAEETHYAAGSQIEVYPL